MPSFLRNSSRSVPSVSPGEHAGAQAVLLDRLAQHAGDTVDVMRVDERLLAGLQVLEDHREPQAREHLFELEHARPTDGPDLVEVRLDVDRYLPLVELVAYGDGDPALHQVRLGDRLSRREAEGVALGERQGLGIVEVGEKRVADDLRVRVGRERRRLLARLGLVHVGVAPTASPWRCRGGTSPSPGRRWPRARCRARRRARPASSPAASRRQPPRCRPPRRCQQRQWKHTTVSTLAAQRPRRCARLRPSPPAPDGQPRTDRSAAIGPRLRATVDDPRASAPCLPRELVDE